MGPPKHITEDQYNILMREIWEMREIMGNYQMDLTLRDQVEYLATEIIATRRENALNKRMLIKIGTTIFKKGIK